MSHPPAPAVYVLHINVPGRERGILATDDPRAIVDHLRALQLDTTSIYDEVRAERARAHTKHGDTSMESCPPDDYRRLAILVEEVGEVAREFNEGHHRGTGPDMALLRKELIQTAAMATAWADVIAPPAEAAASERAVES